MQREIEENMIVEDDVNLVILGDINARLNILEPGKETDENGQMIEEWISEKDMIHLNRSSRCIGKYTFGRPENRRSAIDHILVNTRMGENFKSNEDR